MRRRCTGPPKSCGPFRPVRKLRNGVRNYDFEMVRGRLRQTDECIGPLLIQTPHPGRDGERSYQEDPGGLGKRPAASGAKLKDRQSLGGRIMGTPVGLELLHAGILDANFFSKQLGFLLKMVSLSSPAELTVHALRSPALGQGKGGSRKEDDLNDRRS